MRRLVTPLAALCLVLGARAASLPSPDPDDGGLKLPPGFRALVVADNLVAGRGNAAHLRFLTVAPNGDIYANSAPGSLYALRDTTGSGRADVIREFGAGGGSCIATRGSWLYYSTRTGVYRYPYSPSQLVPTGQPECIVSGLPAGPQHDAKAFAFDDQGRLLVEVGSPYNVYSEGDRLPGARGIDATEFLNTHGGFWRFDPDRLNQTQADGFHYSTGHRHSIALAWNPVSRAFFMVMMGRDNLNLVDPVHYTAEDNAERVAEEMHMLHEGANLGWPYTYYDPLRHARMIAPEFGGDNHKKAPPGKYDEPVIAFPAHWAPLQMNFYYARQFPARYYGGAFVAFHGSWNRAPLPQGGYKVVFVPFDGQGKPRGGYETFADNFSGIAGDFVNPGDARFRPCGVAVGPDGSLFVSDTEKGRIWRIIYTGETVPRPRTPPPAAAAPRAAAALPGMDTPGGRLYQQTCAACHMPDGSGVPNMQPALKGDEVVGGAKDRLIETVLRGAAAALPPERLHYQNVMPPFGAFDDQSIAEILTYVRATMAPGASAVTTEDVAARRAANAPPHRPAGAKVLLHFGDVNLVSAQGGLRIERGPSVIAEIEGFDFNFTPSNSLTVIETADDHVVLRATYPASANYADESRDWPADITVRLVPGGIRFQAAPDWAANVSVRLRDLDDHYFGVIESLYPNNRRSPDLRGEDLDVGIVGGASQYHENYASAGSAFYMTAKGYASFFNTFAEGHYRLGVDGVTTLYHHTGQLDWYLLFGRDGDEILSSYYQVIGPPQAPPFWAMGPVGWRDENKDGAPGVLSDIEHMTRLHIPFTGWWVDRPYSNGAGGWSKMDFDPRFAHPGEWIGRIARDYGIKMMTWVGPMNFTDTDFPGLLPGLNCYYDLSDPAAVAEFRRRLTTEQYAYGIHGHKLDRADEHFPYTQPWHDGTSEPERRDKYLVLYAKALHDSLAGAWGGDQFEFARAAYQGSQQYLSGLWGGDVRSSWDGMGCDLADAMRCGFMGFPVWGSDTGGYLGGRIPEDLYARWLELGAWSGIFEIKLDNNAGRPPDRPPWAYSERLQTIFRQACEQRMQLMPYLYSLAATSARHGVLMKPLAYVWPNDPATYSIADEFLLGPAFLVAPILEPGGHRSIYLPAGTWYDLHDPSRSYPGGRTIEVTEPLEREPIYVRGNSIYVTGSPAIGNSRVWNPNAAPSLTITATPGETGERTQFEWMDPASPGEKKAITLEHTPMGIAVQAPPLGMPATVRVRSGPIASATNGGRPIASAQDGPFTVVSLPARTALDLVLNAAP